MRKFNYVLEASNKDDEKDFRPGLRALSELGILSPLRKFRFRKDEIRNCSKALPLETYCYSSSSCLATRIPYGIKLEQRVLAQIDNAEDYLSELGFGQIRVRHHKQIACIEVDARELKKIVQMGSKIARFFKELGFIYTTVDFRGYQTGSLNQLIR